MKHPWCRIDTDFPGGNLHILHQHWGEDRHLDLTAEPEQRGTTEPWFWWCFRIVAESDGIIHLTLPERRSIAGSGPILRSPSGESRRIPASDERRVDIEIRSPGIWFCSVAHPYQLSDWQAWARRNEAHPLLAIGHIGSTGDGRPLPAAKIGNGKSIRISVTARHHACESLASYVLEGILDAWLEDPGCAWLRMHAGMMAIPMVDLDGVERGDQGKARAPHDHNADYEERRYPEVRAVAETLLTWGQSSWKMALDLHCPWIGGPEHEHIHLVNCPDAIRAARQLHFCERIEKHDSSDLAYRAEQTLAWGMSWNKAPPERRRSFSRWAGGQPGMLIAAGMEIPYAVSNGADVTPSRCRLFGRSIALAIDEWSRNQ